MGLPKKIATACFVRDGWKCRYPGCKSRNNLHPHHVQFKSHGGTDTLDNLLTLCNSCHIDGVHGGRLILEVLERTADNLVVRFSRVGKWKPT